MPASAFQNVWLNSNTFPEFQPWLRKVPGAPNKAKCEWCCKEFNLSNMGVQAIRSHIISKGHSSTKLTVSSNPSIAEIFKLPASSASATVASAPSPPSSSERSSTASPSPSGGLGHFYIRQDVTRAEILWCFKTVAGHLSYRSSEGISALFATMFGDSATAKSFSLSRSKLAYSVAFGLAPFFKSQVESLVSNAEVFVVCFDESLNRVAQRCQMDLVVRIWDSSSNRVISRYLTSVFLERSRAADLAAGFRRGLGSLSLSKVIQISMDGPSVNWKFYNDMKSELDAGLVDTGSCGLHIVNGAFQRGHSAAGWNLNGLFRATYWLFKDSPARRAIYRDITGQAIFPLKFCAVRWTENSRVAARLLDMLPHLKKYVKNVTPKPVNANFTALANAVNNDKLLEAKLHFFISVCGVLEPFLTQFQTAAPLMPMLHGAIERILRALLVRLVKTDDYNRATTAKKLLQLNLGPDSQQLKPRVDIGFGAQAAVNKSGAAQLDVVGLFSSCRKFLVDVVLKIIDKSPIAFPFVRAASSLSPTLMKSQPTLCKTRMQSLLEQLLAAERIAADVADAAKRQFDELLISEKFKTAEQRDRLDDYYTTLLSDNTEMEALFAVVRLVLVMSHGNATVESGFSVNSDIIVENMQETSLVGQRTVYDAINACGGAVNVAITPDLIKSFQKAHKRYKQSLDVQRSADQRDAGEKRRKQKRVADQIAELAAKRANVTAESRTQTAEIDSHIAELKKLL